MKKTVLFILLFLIITFCFETVSADVDPQTLLRTADFEIFVKTGYAQDYDDVQGYVNEFLSGDILHQYTVQNGVGSDIQTSLQGSTAVLSTTNKRLNFIDYRAKVFHARYYVQRTEVIPEDAGYCYVRYSDVANTGVGRESGVILYPGNKAYAFSPSDGKLIYTEIADLSGLNVDGPIRIDVIRLDGVSYFYFDRVFTFQYSDGITNPVAFEGGSEMKKGGNRIRCDFDNFSFTAQ